jgi:hypothetical protein
MDCPEHDRLEGILIQKRASVAKLAPTTHTHAFQKSLIAESQSLADLKAHDGEHGCQSATPNRTAPSAT